MRALFLCLFLAQGCVMTNTVRVVFNESTAPQQEAAVELADENGQAYARVCILTEDERREVKRRPLPSGLPSLSLRVTRLPDPEPPDLKPWQLGLVRANQTPSFQLERKHTKDWVAVAEVPGVREERGLARRAVGWILTPPALAVDIGLVFTVGFFRLLGLG